MGVSAIGERISATTLRKALATVAVAVALFAYFYGPALTPKMRGAAHDRCNSLTGDTYRDYLLQWKTTNYRGINPPHWVCFDLSDPERKPINLGWWVDL
jgi:hypothetical protein